ncbi:pol, partial [Symbiodinium necroappetens]
MERACMSSVVRPHHLHWTSRLSESRLISLLLRPQTFTGGLQRNQVDALFCFQSQQARDTLLRAARDGSLASALEEAREESEPSKPDVELLRQEARDTLLRAAGDGRLAAAFRSVREACKVPKEAKKGEKGEDLEKLRREAAQALVAAAQNGRLAEAISSRKPEVDVEALRLEARSTMIRAAQDGSLREALQQARAETLRAEARDRLLTAARDGRLAAALQRKTAVSEDRTSLEEIREKAKSALLKTLDTGDFQKAMESIRQKRGETDGK